RLIEVVEVPDAVEAERFDETPAFDEGAPRQVLVHADSDVQPGHAHAEPPLTRRCRAIVSRSFHRPGRPRPRSPPRRAAASGLAGIGSRQPHLPANRAPSARVEYAGKSPMRRAKTGGRSSTAQGPEGSGVQRSRALPLAAVIMVLLAVLFAP